MKRITRASLAASAASLAAGAMLAFGGVLPASAAPAGHAVTAATAAASVSVTSEGGGYWNITAHSASGCSQTAVMEFYYSQYDYWNIKVTPTSAPCLGTDGIYITWDAAATCSNYNIWGAETYDYYSVASCDSDHKVFDHGGWRVWIDGGWHYYTEVVTQANE